MARCDSCGAFILLGGVRHHGWRFCSEKCKPDDVVLAIASQIPEEDLAQRVKEVHAGPCPRCGGPGPVDLQTSHRVWSALVVTSWQSRPQLCCWSCGIKAKLADMVFSGLLGWWGFPWGVLATPIQLTRNFLGLFAAPSPYEPSDRLRKFVAISLATDLARSSGSQQAAG